MESSNDSQRPIGFDAEDARIAVGADLDAALAAWVQQAAVDEAAAARARRHWLAVQAHADASLAGVLVDLGERGRPVSLGIGDMAVRGFIVGIGADFVVIRRDDARLVIVAVDAVATVRSQESVSVWGDRRVRVDATLAGILAPVAADRPQVTVWTTAGTTRGTLRSAGTDVVGLRMEDGSRTWLALSSVRAIVVE